MSARRRRPRSPTHHYVDHVSSRRLNKPAGYIDYLKTQPRFASGILDDFPRVGVILHDTRVLEHFILLGLPSSRVTRIETGTTDPNVLFVVYGESKQPSFVVNAGMPGGGGITTQAAELAALGVESIVHIGTCALMGDDVPPSSIVVSTGSYKDGAAVMLSRVRRGAIDASARPSRALRDRLVSELRALDVEPVLSHGYTIPIFYLQPSSLIKDLVLNRHLPGGEPVGYIEMEQSSLFALADRMGFRAASMVVGSDRYRLRGDRLEHSYEEDFDQDEAERTMLRAALAAFGERI